MSKDDLMKLYEKIAPNQEQRSRMRENILNHNDKKTSSIRLIRKRKVWSVVIAACIAAAMIFSITVPLGEEASVYAVNFINKDGAVISFQDNESGSGNNMKSISYVDSRPSLEFYIDGEDIAKIEITAQNEYIYAHD